MKSYSVALVGCVVGVLPLVSVAQSQSGNAANNDNRVVVPGKLKDPPPAPARQNVPIDQALRAKARGVIEEMAKSKSVVLRCNAIEAIQKSILSGPGALFKSDPTATAAKTIILNGLSDPAPLVRFASAVACGELRLMEAYEPLLQMSYFPDADVRLGVRFALHKLGDRRLSQEMLVGLKDPRREVRSNTALLLGLLGEKSAVPALQPLMSDQSPTVRLQAAEALWRLGDERGLADLIAKSISKYPDEQIVALLALAGPKDPRVLEHIRGLMVNEYTEVALAAARASGMLGYDDGYAVASKALTDPDPRRRQMAAFALGAIGRADAQSLLAPLLEDQEPAVRISAATALWQLK